MRAAPFYTAGVNRGYRRAGALAHGHAPDSAHVSPVAGHVVSGACPCRFRHPAAWYFRVAIGDTSQPPRAFHSYNDATPDHEAVPTRRADIDRAGQPDPTGQFYRALTAHSCAPTSEQGADLVVSGLSARSYAPWTD